MGEEKARKIAWAICRALKDENEYAAVDEPMTDGISRSVIDGSFDLRSVAARFERHLQAEGLAIVSVTTAA